MEQLDHQSSKSLERSGYPDCWADFDQNALGGMNVNLKLAGLVNGGVEQSKQTLDVEVSLPR